MARRRGSFSKNRGKKSKSSRRSGDRAAILWVVGAVLLAMLFIYWQNAGVVNKASVAERKVSKTLKKFSIRDTDLSEQKTDKRKIENKSYIHKEKVYKATKDFSFRQFDAKLKKDLDRSEFKIAKSDRAVSKNSESYHATINYGDYDVMDIKVVKPKGAPPPVAVAGVKRFPNPKVAIVLDDFGYNMNNFALLLEIREPITLSILPGLRYSTEVASQARANGYEVILHLPLESVRMDVGEEVDTIRTGMSDSAISARLARELKTVPGADGVSNHQGSKSTSERDTMSSIFKYLKKNDLFFLDSMTSPNSVCRDVASEAGIRYARRDIFLDNSNDISYIESQIAVLKRLAFRKGRVVAIGHDRKNTIIVLRRVIPELKKSGIEIVPLSEIEK